MELFRNLHKVILILFMIVMIPISLFATEETGPKSKFCESIWNCLAHPGGCTTSVPGPHIIQYGSGQDHDLQPFLKSAAPKVYIDVFKNKLGATIPSMVIRYADASDMAALSGTGGHPMPLARDGSRVVAGSQSAAGILEFVVPGPIHHQFIRDTNTDRESLIVLTHVGGHYVFAEKSRLFKMRKPDQMGVSYRMSQRISEIKKITSSKEVAAWHDRLETLTSLQDMTRGTYEPKELFKPENRNQTSNKRAPTQSIL
ncbi:MAG: hypothetical protein SGI74_14725 [Oligoflexia bacterium]|nr:hypothetical protein [Oligoflexia bacterium]